MYSIFSYLGSLDQYVNCADEVLTLSSPTGDIYRTPPTATRVCASSNKANHAEKNPHTVVKSGFNFITF